MIFKLAFPEFSSSTALLSQSCAYRYLVRKAWLGRSIYGVRQSIGLAIILLCGNDRQERIKRSNGEGFPNSKNNLCLSVVILLASRLLTCFWYKDRAQRLSKNGLRHQVEVQAENLCGDRNSPSSICSPNNFTETSQLQWFTVASPDSHLSGTRLLAQQRKC